MATITFELCSNCKVHTELQQTICAVRGGGGFCDQM